VSPDRFSELTMIAAWTLSGSFMMQVCSWRLLLTVMSPPCQ